MRRSLWIIPSILVFAIVGGPTVSRASDITYTVNQTVGAGSVTGFIETDGTIGILGTGNILNWDLVVNDGSVTYDILGPLSGDNTDVAIGGPATTATATEIFLTSTRSTTDHSSHSSTRIPTSPAGRWKMASPVFPFHPRLAKQFLRHHHSVTGLPI